MIFKDEIDYVHNNNLSNSNLQVWINGLVLNLSMLLPHILKHVIFIILTIVHNLVMF